MTRTMVVSEASRNTAVQGKGQMLPTLISSSDNEAFAFLRACISPACFWPPEQILSDSAWLEHAPFAFWLMGALRPRTFVELGTHSGFSYFAFCQAVQRLQLETRCYAVDTWKGDEHAGFYGEEVFREVCSQNDRLYSAFSRLIRSTFDDASRHFVDESIDLLHIDGRHFFDDVKHDFETWRTKLSDRAVVLFHDTNVRERDFGVFRLWNELCRAHPHFEFSHGHGLGVLGIGKELPDQVFALFAAQASVEANTYIQRAYSRLGSAVTFQFRAEHLQITAERQIAGLTGALSERDGKVAALDQTLAERDRELGGVRDALTERDANIAVLDRTLAEREAKVAALDQALAERDRELRGVRDALTERDANIAVLDRTLAERDSELGGLRDALTERDANIAGLQWTISALRASTSWRITAPLRFVKRLPGRFRYSAVGYPLMLCWRVLRTRSRAPLRDWRATRAIARSGLLDSKWYLRNYPDVAASGIDPIRHYVTYGAREGRDPSSSFSTLGYLSHNPDVAAAGFNPLFHLIRYGLTEGRVGGSATPSAIDQVTEVGHPAGIAARPANDRPAISLERKGREDGTSADYYHSRDALEADCRLLRDSGLFDHNTYRAAAGIDAAIDAVEHYLVEGWRTGLEPGPGFQGEFLYPYYRSVGYFGPPAITHLKLRAAGAPAYATLAEAEHWAAPIRGSALFDAVGYAARFDRIDDLDPALHYVIVGEQMGVPPSDAFNPKYYRQRYPDIARSVVNSLSHYVVAGRQEGRRPVSIANELILDSSRLDQRRETILLISHEASRTGAPIVAWNVAVRLRHRYNVVALMIAGGELVGDFEDCCAAVIGPVGQAAWHPVEGEYIVRRLLDTYSISYAIANSTESRFFIPALAQAFVPVISLIHEFSSYTRPKGAMAEGLDWSTQIVFSSEMTANSATSEHPHLANRTIHVLPQGRCDVPRRRTTKAPSAAAEGLRDIFRPSGCEDALVVLGAGFVHIRKGVDLFLACAAAVSALDLKRPVRFIWIGDGYDLLNDPGYSTYLSEQIMRSGLATKVAIIDAIDDLEPAYAMADVFFLSSRLDPLPNVTIDAAFHGLPVVCFDNASGMATLLAAEASLRPCVVPHLDVNAAAYVIAQFANNEEVRACFGSAMRYFADATFDMDRYVSRLDELGREAIDIMRQRAQDFITVRDDTLFDETMFLPPNSLTATREDAIRQFLARWAAVGTSCKPATDFYFRRPCAGFHPQVYAHDNSKNYDTANVNPLAHFIWSGKPEGPWCHEVITPALRGNGTARSPELRCAIHAHFYYPELMSDFLRKLECNSSRCDLMLTTDTKAKARSLRSATRRYARGEVLIRVVPNRGRDIGPLLTAHAEEIAQHYDLIGHVHGKRSLAVDAAMGETWREFLWQNLLGDLHPMMDVIVERFANDERLGIVFPSDPHLCDWDNNREIAEHLAGRMGIKEPLAPFFDYPNGTMFWARAAVLKPLFDLKLGSSDYPEEPLPNDGTILHALERLLPFVARHAGYGFAVTHVPGMTW